MEQVSHETVGLRISAETREKILHLTELLPSLAQIAATQCPDQVDFWLSWVKSYAEQQYSLAGSSKQNACCMKMLRKETPPCRGFCSARDLWWDKASLLLIEKVTALRQRHQELLNTL